MEFSEQNFSIKISLELYLRDMNEINVKKSSMKQVCKGTTHIAYVSRYFTEDCWLPCKCHMPARKISGTDNSSIFVL